MRGEGECEFGYGLLELAALLLWAATLVLGVALRLGDFGRAAQHTGDMLVGTSGFAFLAVAFLLMADRPEQTPAVGDRALTRRRCRQFRRMTRRPLLARESAWDARPPAARHATPVLLIARRDTARGACETSGRHAAVRGRAPSWARARIR